MFITDYLGDLGEDGRIIILTTDSADHVFK
jgi:hypothetical protein